MRRVLVVILSTVLTAGTLALTAAPASAAAPVRISAPKPAVAPHLGTARVEPRVTAAKKVKLVSRRITVAQGGRTLVTSRSSARLKAGTYRVTTVVRYRPTRTAKVRTKRASHRVVVRQVAKNCATGADLARVRTIFDGTEGDSRAVADGKLSSPGTYVETTTLGELRTLFVLFDGAVPPEVDAAVARFGASAQLYVRDYRLCGDGRRSETFVYVVVDGEHRVLF